MVVVGTKKRATTPYYWCDEPSSGAIGGRIVCFQLLGAGERKWRRLSKFTIPWPIRGTTFMLTLFVSPCSLAKGLAGLVVGVGGW